MIARLKRLRHQLLLAREYVADFARYRRASAPLDGAITASVSPRHKETQVTKDYHRVEKGLALPAPKRPFGAEVEARLVTLVGAGGAEKDAAPFERYGVSALQALRSWNDGGDVDPEVSPVRAPATPVDPEVVETLFTSRHSVRDFADRPVPQDLLRRATELARLTPSVCNRQAWHVRYFSAPDAQRVLKHQNGNAGFRDSVPCVAVISVDARLFAGPGERNQPWIEGGLFSMSLSLALHGLGVDTCMLNWSMTNAASQRLRAEAGMEPWELVIMMMAIGYGAEGHRVARSPRRDVGEIAKAGLDEA